MLVHSLSPFPSCSSVFSSQSAEESTQAKSSIIQQRRLIGLHSAGGVIFAPLAHSTRKIHMIWPNSRVAAWLCAVGRVSRITGKGAEVNPDRAAANEKKAEKGERWTGDGGVDNDGSNGHDTT